MQRDEWRLMSWIAAAQIMGLILGWIALGVAMKFVGYPMPEKDLFIRWHSLAIPLREQGHWFLLLIVLWCVSLGVANIRWPAVLKTMTVTGLLLAVLIPGLFLLTLTNLYTRQLLIGPQQSSQSQVVSKTN